MRISPTGVMSGPCLPAYPRLSSQATAASSTIEFLNGVPLRRETLKYEIIGDNYNNVRIYNPGNLKYITL